MSFNPFPDPDPGDRIAADAVELLIIPRAVDLGGMSVHRALPSHKRQMVGPFIFFDQMGPAEFLTDQGIDVRPHPHINLSTLTYLLEGEILHRDSLGTEIAIQPGAVNWMRAGSGIVHSERTSSERRVSGQRLFGLQTWMALPVDIEESDPAFMHHPASDLPTLDSNGVSARLIAGEMLGVNSPLQTSSATLYADIQLKAGASLPVEDLYDERALYTLSGTIDIGSDSFNPGQLIIIRRGARTVIKASNDARFMLFGGDPMEGPRYMWWNFVSSRLSRIELAKEEWSQGRFDTVPGDEAEFIPLPKDNNAPLRSTGANS
ncbi:MAG: pirin family protein [Granulosicoccus sp.]